MDQINIVILSVKAEQLPFVSIEASDGNFYKADLSRFKPVHCFPTSQQEWEDVDITATGFNLTWGCRFEVHAGQIISHAVEVSSVKKQA